MRGGRETEEIRPAMRLVQRNPDSCFVLCCNNLCCAMLCRIDACSTNCPFGCPTVGLITAVAPEQFSRPNCINMPTNPSSIHFILFSRLREQQFRPLLSYLIASFPFLGDPLQWASKSDRIALVPQREQIRTGRIDRS